LNSDDLLAYIKQSASQDVTCTQIKGLMDVCVALNEVAGYEAANDI